MAGFTASQVREALSYDPFTGLLVWNALPRACFDSDMGWKVWNAKYPGKQALTAVNSKGYLCGKFRGKYLSAHRAAFACMTGELPEQDVDHIDGQKENNSWSNLRLVSHSENCSNRAMHKNNTSGEVGVSFDKKSQKWRAKIKNTVIGLFEDWPDAVVARRLAVAIDGSFTDRHGNKGV